jgi:hypothetical protein
MVRGLYIAIFLILPLQASFIPLPTSLSSKAVYHCDVEQLNDFSCRYNGLFNACNFEQCCGFQNPGYAYSFFKRICLDYTRSHGLNPRASSTTIDTETLAYDHLFLQPSAQLGEEYGRIFPYFRTNTSITYDSRTPDHEVQRMLKRAVAKKENDFIQGLCKKLDTDPRKNMVIHFFCSLDLSEGRHCILVSLLQNSTGRGLYIFDNMNMRLYENCHAMKYIDYLCSTFKVSAKKSFLGPKLPHRWPGLRK